MKHKHHKIIFKDGKRIRTNELITLTLEEHAKEHKRLYKLGGHWQDKLAYEGLSGQVPKQELIKRAMRENGLASINLTLEVRKKAIENARKANMGRKLTEEHKAKINPIGRKQPQSQKDKVAAALSMDYIITYPNGNEISVTNLRQFSIKNNLDQGNLTKVAQGTAKQHKGFLCRYL